MKFLILILFGPILFFYQLKQAKSNRGEKEMRQIVYCSPSFDPATLNAANAPFFEGLGNHHYPITSSSEKAKQYFDQGLTLIYAFNHGEAGRSFKAAIKLDSTCAMAYWGLAMVLGPNYNSPLNPASLKDINDAVDKAVLYAENTSPNEQALIRALRHRFPTEEVRDMTPYNEAYANAMKHAHEAFYDDPDIAALYVDAMMNEHPWNLWKKDGNPQPWTSEIVKTIEALLAKAPEHPGANHMYIHIMEASLDANKALPSADRLPGLVPAAGHLVHMPSHIYIRTGNYHKGVIANENATAADSSYIAQCKVEGVYPMMYFPHNIHFLAACAFLEGNSEKAVDAAWSVSRHADKKYILESAAIQHYSIIPFYVLVQMGKWKEILDLPWPQMDLQYPVAVWHYARGMAFTAKGNLNQADAELAALKTIAKNEKLDSLLIWGTNSAAQLARIAVDVLSGELSAKRGAYKEAIAFLTHAKEIEDGLMYQEPPDWFFSTRHTLGHILLQAKQYLDAERVYLEDLITYPENGWALMGLYQSLVGQGKKQEAAIVKRRFDTAWKYADLKISSSRVY
jgi:tetratricopeptide (TPR) repeat protein